MQEQPNSDGTNSCKIYTGFKQASAPYQGYIQAETESTRERGGGIERDQCFTRGEDFLGVELIFTLVNIGLRISTVRITIRS